MSAKKRNQVGKYTLFQTLGEGTFGKVKYATHIETDRPFAVKVLDKEQIQQHNMGKQMKREISIMKLVNNPHVVRMEEVLASKTKIYLVLELVTGGELFDEIVRDGKFTEEKARFYFRQLVKGVEYCHGKGVCHRDLKPENLLLDSEKNLKISDFGLSALYEGDGTSEDGSAMSSRASLLHTTCGTPNYVAPEVLKDEGYDGVRADVWSMGVILYVLVSGCLPFDEPTMKALFEKIQNAEFRFPKFLSDELKDLISKILLADPLQRYTINDIQNDPWFTKEDNYSNNNDPQNVGEQNSLISQLQRNSINENNSFVQSTPSDLQFKRDFQFCFKNGPPSLIMTNIRTALKNLKCDINEDSHQPNKIRVVRKTPRGIIGMCVQLHCNEDGATQMVEVKKGKGDIMEYHVLFREVKEKLDEIMENSLGHDEYEKYVKGNGLKDKLNWDN